MTTTPKSAYLYRMRSQGKMLLRGAHMEEFEAGYRQALRDGKSQAAAYHAADQALINAYPAEYAGYRQPSLVKRTKRTYTHRMARSSMDPMDAVILFERGMTLEQIAAYDGCTQGAVLKALVPQFPRKSTRAWGELLDTDARFVHRFVKGRAA